jgi:hypothetical protein
MPFCSEQGFETYAVSLRGTAGTQMDEETSKRGSVLMSEHVSPEQETIACSRFWIARSLCAVFSFFDIPASMNIRWRTFDPSFRK